MPIRVYCNACHKHIKDVTRHEINGLTGEEICQECEAGVKSAFDNVEKYAKRGIVQIETLRDKIKAELDSMRKKVIKSDEQA